MSAGGRLRLGPGHACRQQKQKRHAQHGGRRKGRREGKRERKSLSSSVVVCVCGGGGGGGGERRGGVGRLGGGQVEMERERVSLAPWWWKAGGRGGGGGGVRAVVVVQVTLWLGWRIGPCSVSWVVCSGRGGAGTRGERGGGGAKGDAKVAGGQAHPHGGRVKERQRLWLVGGRGGGGVVTRVAGGEGSVRKRAVFCFDVSFKMGQRREEVWSSSTVCNRSTRHAPPPPPPPHPTSTLTSPRPSARPSQIDAGSSPCSCSFPIRRASPPLPQPILHPTHCIGRISSTAREPPSTMPLPPTMQWRPRGLPILLLLALLLVTSSQAFFLALTMSAATGSKPQFGGIAHAGILVSNTQASLVGDRSVHLTINTHPTMPFFACQCVPHPPSHLPTHLAPSPPFIHPPHPSPTHPPTHPYPGLLPRHAGLRGRHPPSAQPPLSRGLCAGRRAANPLDGAPQPGPHDGEA